ncbi:INVS [Symbiodinium sp. CCMP2592]|nr:INVS [Symbiodinium sp. CCMP2592]
MDDIIPGFKSDSMDPATFFCESFMYQNGFRDVSDRDEAGWTPICYAALGGNAMLLSSLVEKKADPRDSITKSDPKLFMTSGATLLTMCVFLRHHGALRLLLERKADANATDGFTSTPMHYACVNHNVEAIQILRDAGANVDVVNKLQHSPRMLAGGAGTGSGSEDVIEYLLSDAPQSEINFALHYCILFAGVSVDVVSALIRKGADINQQLVLPRFSPLGMAFTYFSWRHRWSPTAAARLTRVSFYAMHHSRASPLMCCIICGCFDAAAALIAAGARLDLKNIRGKTAADLAHENGAPDFLLEALQAGPAGPAGPGGPGARQRLDLEGRPEPECCPLRTYRNFPKGDLAAADALSVLASYEVPANQLPLRSLRRVLQWLGVDARSLEEVLPAVQLPNPGDAQEPEFRLRLQKLRIVYQDFAQRLEKGLGRAQLQLRPPEALVVPAPPSPPADLEARCHAAQARESAANRRCVVLEQEVRTKDRIAKELQRQVGELDHLVERLESELYEERGSKVNLMAQLNASLPKAEVEPKLRQLEELKFQVDQSSLALKQSKDLARVCAAQAESYEQLVKRRQQEVRNLQESVKMLQAGDEVANTVGKLQYRLLLCQWEKGNVQRQLQTATQDLRQARRELLENEEQVEQERQEHDQTEELLRHRLTEASTQAAQLAEQSAAAMPVDKARQLTSRLEEISSRKMELEEIERLSKVRLELLRNQAETDSCRLRAQQAQELLMELKALDPDSEAPRQRLLEMAKKLADSKLQELQHKRSLEIVKEQHQQLEKARQADEKEIQNLQREVANAESKLADQEQQWRAKVLEAQGAAPATAVRRAGQISIEALEEIQGKVSERDARIAVLESDLQKSKADRESALAEERAKVRKLELELGLVAEGDMAKLRQALRAEHDAEVAQISQAAQELTQPESVQTLQQLLDQTEEHLQRQQQDTARLHQNLSEQRAKHAEETMQLQQEIAGLRQELFQIRHQQQSDVGASARLSPLPPPPPDESARLGDSIGSEAFGGMEGLGNRLDEQREQVVSLHHRLEQQHEEFQSLLDQQHQEARRREEQLRGREERLHQEYQAREQRLLDLQEGQRQQRDQELLRIKEELASLHSANGANAEAQQQREEQVAEAQRHADLALQHNALAEQNRLSAESWQRKATELEAELQKERQKHQESTMRKQQASLRRQLANKEEQLGSLRKAVEELKDRVVQLTVRNEREEMTIEPRRFALEGLSATELICQLPQVRKRITGQEEKMQNLKDQVRLPGAVIAAGHCRRKGLSL